MRWFTANNPNVQILRKDKKEKLVEVHSPKCGNKKIYILRLHRSSKLDFFLHIHCDGTEKKTTQLSELHQDEHYNL